MTKDLMEEIIRVAVEAGDRIMKIYEGDIQVEHKDDSSPLTEADRRSHEHIVSELKKITPEIPILSEESADISWQERKGWGEYWLVDPLDGTKEFIKKNGEFTVNIALIKENSPATGVVVIPAQNLIYGADIKNGSFRRDYDGREIELTANNNLNANKLKIVGSRSHQSGLMQTFVSNFENYEIVAAGSSLKFCLLAEGKADVYPRFGPTSEWDTAAGQCVLECAGGVVFDNAGNKLQYNTKDSVLNPYFIAMREYNETVLNCFKEIVGGS
ncbi:MAG: 3'(2'),5'-bisphosphate nucleotidase CysQ [Flexistipes sinusarabici]|uniref:3'(2'),5'-bisphosphate nucleotidase CysQ n=1 Tax=Flexistipes sinusarabici TaxID=2352 RepID=A0A5D0MIS9_FLESI|nr:3'(2'),5'-bisphosphate nucleotidase CysQ [Flexistipes sinusarabici]TYB33587.1 MAG: 3'(2'),5'-bisphosphate nucleotidase CysQ [Flexistipes sinusarabici]